MEKQDRPVKKYKELLDLMLDGKLRKIGVTKDFYKWLTHEKLLDTSISPFTGEKIVSCHAAQIYIWEDENEKV